MMRADPAQLAALAAVVDEGTFEAAARRLHVTPSAISQRLKTLETSIGRVLVTRTKPVRVTPAGEVVLRLARQFELLTADAQAEIGADGGPTGSPVTIPLAVNADSLATWFPAAIADVGPRYTFDIRTDDQERTLRYLRDGTVMAAITPVSEPVPGCSVHRLGRMRYRPAAAPAFVRRWFAGGPTPEQFQHAPIVCFDRVDQVQDRYLRMRTRRYVAAPRHYVPSSTAFAEAVAGGLGWGMLLEVEIAALRRRVHLLDPDRTVDVTLYWQQWRLRSAALDAVADAVRAAAAAALG
jgi:LysR family transcriptional regulator (chromosome initiation inhibitor)